MYTNLKNVQVVISLLKQHNISKVVISPGSRNVPFVHSIEQDDFFTCYSFVDERSAAFFALGLSESSGESVVLTCTSSTATANYLPAIKEAFTSKCNLIALTFDRDYRKLYKMEDQMINQVEMYRKYCLSSINIPIIKEKDDLWYATSQINEAFLTQLHIKNGPIQVNVQVDDFGDFSCNELPKYRKVNYVNEEDFFKYQDGFKNKLSQFNRILVLCGQDMSNDNDMIKYLELFQEKYSSVVSYDDFSIARSSKFIKTLSITESMHIEDFEQYAPDLVITIGGHIWSFIKYKLRHVSDNFEHWNISKYAETKDAFNSLTYYFNFESKIFFENIVNCNFISDKVYYIQWENRVNNVVFPRMYYSNFYAIKRLLEVIPENSLLHMSILNSIRISNFVGTPYLTECYANLGTDGIDGCLSTFLGQSADISKFSFLIIGDLSSLYDYGGFQYLQQPNQRIMIINNNVGSEFYNNFGSYIDTVDDFIGARHNSALKGITEFNNVDYLSCRNEKEFEDQILKFVSSNEKPIVFEVFTDASKDTSILQEYYKLNLHSDFNIKMKKVLKKLKIIK